MLFNSPVFLFAFLPVVLAGFAWLARRGAGRAAIGWLVACSFFFYAWWNPPYVSLLAVSVAANYGLARLASARPAHARTVTTVAIAFDLALLGWFKYAGFLVSSIARPVGADWQLADVTLPLAISFFTFQQITYQLDHLRGVSGRTPFLPYALFVTFFPQLIAGPIVHPREVLPQFADRARFRLRSRDASIGLTILAIGLFKKVVLADGIAPHVTPLYSAAALGRPMDLLEGWTAAVGYSLQLYFDFSGYSDMAIGLARLFGIVLPLNFHSPFKAVNVVEFWRRWHMTLSRFLLESVYIPLGGNRHGTFARYRNLLVTMLLGGLWHGAGFTFVLWGGLHGVLLILAHGWLSLRRRAAIPQLLPSRVARPLAIAFTFALVAAAFALFRAESVATWREILAGMASCNGVRPLGGVSNDPGALKAALAGADLSLVGVEALCWTGGLLAIAWALPNTQQLFLGREPGIDVYGHLARSEAPRDRWAPDLVWASFTLWLLAVSLYRMMVQGRQEFIYRIF